MNTPIPSYHAFILYAWKHYHPRRSLGRGADREAFLTREGKVLKVPRHYLTHGVGNCGGHGGNPQAQCHQTKHELQYIERGETPSGCPTPKGHAVYILGVECILMEFVHTNLWEYFPEPARIPRPHREAYRDKVAEAIRAYHTNDGQKGMTIDGRLVCYDSGVEHF